MHFSSDINRPPYEAQDGFLQVTSGCSHGRCAFCTFYKDATFQISRIEEIEEDIKELAAYGWPYQRIYLQGADPFILPFERLMKIAELIHLYLPTVRTIGGYARIDNLKNKSVEELRLLKEAGYSNFYFGNESGDDVLLEQMEKGYQAEEVVTQLKKLDEAGMAYVMNFLGGLGGAGYGLNHARKSADVINQLHPSLVYASELTLFEDTPLTMKKQMGEYEEASETERLIELRELIDKLETKTVFKAEHVTIPVPIRGRIPEDKERMLKELDLLIKRSEQGAFDHYRTGVMGL